MMTQTACFQGLDLEVENVLLADYDEVEASIWQERTLSDLTDVSDLLDCLESSGVNDRKLYTQTDGTFLVMWRV
jgi:hypothetical protein